MNLDHLQLFSVLKERMSWLSERQKVLADNVANADTPGYKARDLKPLSFKETLRASQSGVALARTSSGHIAVTQPQQQFSERKIESEASPVGNNVLLEEQMLKSAKTVADYRLMTNLYTKHVALIKTALSRGR